MAPTAVDVAEVQMMKVEEAAVADVVGVAAEVADVVAGEGVVAGVGGAEGAEDVEGEVVAVEYHSDSNQQEVRGLGTSENKYTREGCD